MQQKATILFSNNIIKKWSRKTRSMNNDRFYIASIFGADFLIFNFEVLQKLLQPFSLFHMA
jgi:hypothetical protein